MNNATTNQTNNNLNPNPEVVMTISLPTPNHPAAELFDADTIEAVAALLHPSKRSELSSLQEVLRRVKESSSSDVSASYCVCMKANGAIVMERIGPRGGHKTIWTFAR